MDSVARAGGDRTATKPVFPADTGKTDHQKDRIILSLLYKFRVRSGFKDLTALSLNDFYYYFYWINF